jgi:prepilin-type N-terminal cleavage/methylation domain-containing protein
MIAPGSSREDGLSLIEVLVALLIMSLALGIILPIASRSVISNLTLGERALSAGNADVSEVLFRRVLASAVAPGPDYRKRPTTVTGDAEQARLFAPAGGARPCGSAISADVELVIRKVDGGGRLVCLAGDEEVELFRWSAGAGAFSYSPNGKDWSSSWEPRDVRAPSGEIEAVVVPAVDRPFLRFSVTAPGAPQRSFFWIERVGVMLERPLDPRFLEPEGASSTVRLPEP